jgi:hypothetical protein
MSFPEGQIMGFSTKNVMAGMLAVAAVSSTMCMPAEAYYNGYVGHSKTNTVRGYFYRHPKVKAATVGAGLGTAAGAATGLISGRGVMRGALIGAGAGTGVGLIRSSEIMRRHPLVKNTATGSVVGLGLGMAASRGHHSGLKGAAVGGAVGLGLGALSNVLR